MKSFKHSGKKTKLFDAIKQNNIEISYNLFNKLIRKKDIKINGIRVNSNIEIDFGDEVVLYMGDNIKTAFSPEIIYEDENILIINKPEKILTTGACSLEELLKSSLGEVYACHRLDRNTSGLVVFAKNIKSYDEITAAFKNGLVEKFYYCLSYGVFIKQQENLTAYLFKDSKKAFSIVKDKPLKGYVKIETAYRVLKQHQDYAELEVKLITGKTHQIRAHMAFIGHPLIGDGKYGSEEINNKFSEHTQNLISYKLKFNFYDVSCLSYLNNLEFKLK